jgi:Ca2+-binding RTX toxin-like protein
LDTTADDGAGNGLTEKDKILGDFEVVTGTKYDDVLVAGNLGGNAVAGEPTKASAYTLNGSDGNDVLASQQNYGTAFNGGAGVDTVTYAGRAAGVTVTMDGKTADDGEKAANGGPTAATLDNVAVDIENLIGSDLADKITGNASNNWFKPGAGSDVVVGGDGDDLMLSGKADGSDAADGDDIFQGGVGNDTIDYSNRIAAPGVTVNLDCAFTAATVAGTKSAGTASGAGGESDYIGVDVENVVGTVGDDTLNGSSVPNSI